MTPPTEGGDDLPVDWWKRPTEGEPWSVTLDTGEVIEHHPTEAET